MKVYIGPYRNWFGPYQLAEFLCFWARRNNEYPKWVYSFADWLDRSMVGEFLRNKWMIERTNPTVKVRIDPYDTWSMDHTLAYIIYPMLVQLKRHQHGAGHVDDEDVPEELRSTNAPKPDPNWVDDNHFKRWNWVMEEMIWAFEQHVNYDWMDDGEYEDRRQNGFRLFGKYYQKLWD